MVESRFPRFADNPPQFLIWEVDEITPLMLCFIIFLPARNLILGLVMGIILMKIYKKLKDRLPQYFYFHYLWYFGIWNPKMKKTVFPKGHITVYRE